MEADHEPNTSADLTDLEIERLGQVDFDAELTNQQISESEAKYEQQWGVQRRIALCMLARSKQELMAGFAKDGDTDLIFQAVDGLSAWRDHLKACIEISEKATARLLGVASAVIHGDAAAPPASRQ